MPAASSARAHAAIAMRVSGAPLDAIASMLGYDSPAQAGAAIESALAATTAERDIEAARALYYSRLDMLLNAVWDRAVDNRDPEQISYVRTALAIEERRARLMGADAPQRHEVYSPTAEQIAAHVQAVIRANPATVIEADVVPQLSDKVFEDAR